MSRLIQTDLNERVTGKWNEQEVAVQSVFVDHACISCERLHRVDSQRVAGADCGLLAW